MKQKNWVSIEKKIKLALEDELKSSDRRPVAVFDADGTLWNTDLGEAFFKYQIRHRLLKNLPAECLGDPWAYYREKKKSGDPRAMFLWLAEINCGYKLSQVRAWAELVLREQENFPLFEEQKRLIEYFLSKRVEVFIVTASVAWAVEPGAQRLGISTENVIGVRTKVRNGRITDEQDGIITYQEGKPQALLEATAGHKPFFASGNSMGDLALLEIAKVSLAVGATKEGDELFASEERLRQEALARGWLIHEF